MDLLVLAAFFFNYPLFFIASILGEFHYSSHVLFWDCREVLGYARRGAKHESWKYPFRDNPTEAPNPIFNFRSYLLFCFKAKKEWVGLWHIAHASSSIQFCIRGKAHKCWVVGQQCVFFFFFFLWRIKIFFSRLTSFNFLIPQFKAAKYYRLAEDNGSKTLGNSWYVILHPASLFFFHLFFFFSTLLLSVHQSPHFRAFVIPRAPFLFITPLFVRPLGARVGDKSPASSLPFDSINLSIDVSKKKNNVGD